MKTINLKDDADRNRLETVKNSTANLSSFFTGVDDLISLNLDPYVTGFSFIYWVKLPDWFEEDEDLRFFRTLTEKNFLGFSGLGSIELETGQQISGFAGNTFDSVTGINKGNTSFSIRLKEFSGAVMRKLYQKWVYLVRDPRTGIALYPKLFGIEYGARNHTAQLLYINCRPDVTNTDSKEGIVEFAAFYSNVFPKSVPLDMYNYSIGDSNIPEFDEEFSGNIEIGPSVEAYAADILKNKILNISDGAQGIPFIDAMGTNPLAVSRLAEKNLTKEIFSKAVEEETKK